MAANTSENDVVELEVKLIQDDSWHPCNVSLCPSGALLVQYEKSDFKIVLKSEEALACLRIRSRPLRGDDCTYIEKGDHVLATQVSPPKSHFFDAEVAKVERVRHSKKSQCRCTFTIKWLHQDLEGKSSTVPSRSIMKLSRERINAHPVVSEFLNVIGTMDYSCSSPYSTLVDGMDLHLYDLLEKQIEDINNSVNYSKEKIRGKQLLFEVYGEEAVQRSFVASNVSKSTIGLPCEKNSLRRSTRSKNNAQTINDGKDPISSSSSIEPNLSEIKSPLNSFAACAALASLMSTPSQNLKFSLSQEGKKCVTSSSDATSFKQVNMESLKVTPKTNQTLKSLLADVSGDSVVLDMSSNLLLKECEKGWKTPEALTSGKISHPKQTTRLTRSAAQIVTHMSGDITEMKSCIKDNKSRSRSRRFTRSTQIEQGSQTSESIKVAEANISAKCDASATFDHNVSTEESCILEAKKVVSDTSPLSPETESLPVTAKRSCVEIEREIENDEREKICVKDMKNSMRRLTRSVVHGYAAKKTVESIQAAEKAVGDTSPLNVCIQSLPIAPETSCKKIERDIKINHTEKICVEVTKNLGSIRRLTRSAVHKDAASETVESIRAAKEVVANSLPLNSGIELLTFTVKRSHKNIDSEIENNDSEQIRMEEVKNLGSMRRLTRSAVHRNGANKTLESTQAAKNLVAESSLFIPGTEFLPITAKRSHTKMERACENNVSEKICVEEIKTLGSLRKLTRSAVCKDAGNKTVESILEAKNADAKNSPQKAGIKSLPVTAKRSRINIECETEVIGSKKICPEEIKNLGSMRRLTRSTVQEDAANKSVKSIQAAKKAVSDTSPPNAGIKLLPITARRGRISIESGININVSEKICVEEIKNLGRMTRLTRSAFHKDAATETGEFIQAMEANEFPKNVISKSSEESGSILHVNKSGTASLGSAGGRNKKMKMSGSGKSTLNEDTDVSDGGSSQEQKRKSISSNKLADSAQVRFLPRTRSQSRG